MEHKIYWRRTANDYHSIGGIVETLQGKTMDVVFIHISLTDEELEELTT